MAIDVQLLVGWDVQKYNTTIKAFDNKTGENYPLSDEQLEKLKSSNPNDPKYDHVTIPPSVIAVSYTHLTLPTIYSV